MIQLTRRERRLGISVIAVGAVWALYGFVIEPTRDRIHTLHRIIPEKQNELREVQALSSKYVALRQEVENVQRRMAEQDSDFLLLPFLESLIEQHEMTPYVVTMERDTRPSQPGYSETLVEIGLEGMTLRQLVRFLEAVETSGALIHIGNLDIHRNSENAAQLDSRIQIHSPRLASNAVASDTVQP